MYEYIAIYSANCLFTLGFQFEAIIIVLLRNSWTYLLLNIYIVFFFCIYLGEKSLSDVVCRCTAIVIDCLLPQFMPHLYIVYLNIYGVSVYILIFMKNLPNIFTTHSLIEYFPYYHRYDGKENIFWET